MNDGNGKGQLVPSAVYRLQVAYDF